MQDTTLFRYSGWSAYLSVVATAISQENLLFIVGSLAVVVGYPVWAIWLGRTLLSDRVAAPG